MMKPSRRQFLLAAGAIAAADGGRAQEAGEEFDWLRTARIVLAEGYVPPFYPRLQCSGKQLASIAAEMGANVLRFPAISQYALYPTRHYTVHPELGSRDLFQETIEACHAQGIRVIPYIAVNVSVWPKNTQGEVRDWIGVDAQGNPTTSTLFSLDREGNYLQACLLSPIRDRIKAYVEEIVSKYDVAGMYFDGPYPYMSSQKCYCKYCSQAYQKAFGKPVPRAGSGLSPEDERQYYRWFSQEVVAGLMKEIRQIVRTRKNVPMILNLTPFLFPRAYSEAQYPISDAFMFESRPGPITNKMYNLVMARSTGKYIWSYVSTPHLESTEHLRKKRLGSWYSSGVDGREVEMQGFTVIASGAAPIYWGANNRYRSLGNVQSLRRPYDFLQENAAILKQLENARFAGIYTSTSTVDWYRYKPNGEAGYHPSFYYGAYALLKDLHIQAEPFHESQVTVETLRRYRLVYLPNVACLSRAHADLIREYVRSGGALLATYETSLFDEWGKSRSDFALADVFGASWRESPDWGTDLFLRFEGGRSPQLFPEGTEIPHDPDFTLIEAAEENSMMGRVVQPASKSIYTAGLVVRRFGAGRVAYISGSPEAVYYESRLAGPRELVHRVVDHLCGDEAPPFHLEAPNGVFANLAVSERSLLLHVLADVGNKWKGLVSREEYVPVPGIVARIRIPRGRTVRSPRYLRSKAECRGEVVDGSLTLRMPPVEIYEGIYLEFA